MSKELILDLNEENPYEAFLFKISRSDYNMRIGAESENLFFNLFNRSVGSHNCIEEFEKSQEFEHSKLGRLSKRQKRIEYSWPESTNFEVFQWLYISLDEEDLKHPLYRFIILASFANRFVIPRPSSCGGPWLSQMSFPWKDENGENIVRFEDTLNFYMDSFYSTELNGDKIQFEDISTTVSDLLRKNYKNSNTRDTIEYIGYTNISVLLVDMKFSEEASSNSSYDLYDQLVIGYETVYNELSLDIFGLPYNDMDDNYRRAIRKIIPVYLNED